MWNLETYPDPVSTVYALVFKGKEKFLSEERKCATRAMLRNGAGGSRTARCDFLSPKEEGGIPRNQINHCSTAAVCTHSEAECRDAATKEPHQNPWEVGSADWDVQNGRSNHMLGCCTIRGDACCEFGHVW